MHMQTIASLNRLGININHAEVPPEHMQQITALGLGDCLGSSNCLVRQQHSRAAKAGVLLLRYLGSKEDIVLRSIRPNQG
jgi:hypothetical protein